MFKYSSIADEVAEAMEAHNLEIYTENELDSKLNYATEKLVHASEILKMAGKTTEAKLVTAILESIKTGAVEEGDVVEIDEEEDKDWEDED